MEHPRQRLFIEMTTSLFRTQQSVDDLFFKKRLSEEIEHVMEEHIQYSLAASLKTTHGYISSLKVLEKLLQEILYLEKAEIIYLSVSREKVLKLILDLLQTNVSLKEELVTEAVLAPKPKSDPISFDKKIVTQKVTKNKQGLSKAQEKILEFVRQVPECRTKDVVQQFSALSPRTVKRGLKELNETGKITKRFDSGAVYYSAV